MSAAARSPSFIGMACIAHPRQSWPLRSNPTLMPGISIDHEPMQVSSLSDIADGDQKQQVSTREVPRRYERSLSPIAEIVERRRLTPSPSSLAEQGRQRLSGASGFALGSVGSRTGGMLVVNGASGDVRRGRGLSATAGSYHTATSGGSVSSKSSDRSVQAASGSRRSTPPSTPRTVTPAIFIRPAKRSLANGVPQPRVRSFKSRFIEHLPPETDSAEAVCKANTVARRTSSAPKINSFHGAREPVSKKTKGGAKSKDKIKKPMRWIDERTVRRNNRTRLRRRAVCIAYRDESPSTSSQAQARSGDFLPCIRGGTSPVERPQIDRCTGSLRRRRTHRLKGCNHIIHMKNPTACASNCECDSSLPHSPSYEDKEHPCAQCAAHGVSRKYAGQMSDMQRYREFLASLTLDGLVEADAARRELTRWNDKYGRVWEAQMSHLRRAKTIRAARHQGMDRGSIAYTINCTRSLSAPQILEHNRLSDYRGHERSLSALRVEMNSKGQWHPGKQLHGTKAYMQARMHTVDAKRRNREAYICNSVLYA